MSQNCVKLILLLHNLFIDKILEKYFSKNMFIQNMATIRRKVTFKEDICREGKKGQQ